MRRRELAGTFRTHFDEGTSDAARWFALAEMEARPHVDLVDAVLGRI